MSNSHDDIPWTIQQIRENSSKWTLEGDAKLLLYLEAFSNTLCKRSKTTKAKLDSMVSTLEYTQISLANSTNRFHALQHSQFVESRVYEEDIQADTCPKEEKVLQDSKIDPGVIAKQAVMCGLKLMENEYMKVQIGANNSEQPRFKYVPKDRYMSRPLPLRIGSKEFLASLNPSESESEGGFGSSRSRSPSIASSQSKSYSPSLTNPSVQKYDISSITKGNSSILGHSSEEEDDKIFENSVEQHKSPNNKTSSDIDNTKNKREQFPTPRHSYPILFNDGPPLLEDLYEADKPKKNDLFEDDDENSDELFDDKSKVKNIANKTSIIFHGQNENKSQAVNLFDEEPPEIDVSKTAQNIPKVTNLFDDDSEDDLFATVTSSHKNQVKANTYKSEDTVGIFSDKPPEIINSKLKGAIKKQIENIKTDVEDDILDSENTSNNITPKGTNIKTLQKNNLFEDDEDEIKFDTNLFNKNSLLSETSKQITFKLFDDEPPIDFEASSTSAKDENKKNKSFSIDKKFSLFSDSDDDDIFDSLIKNDSSDKSKSKVQVNPTITPKNEIKNIVFEASSNKIDPSTKLDSKQKSKINELFEDDDDLFSTKPVINVSKTNQTEENNDILGKNRNIVLENEKNESIFNQAEISNVAKGVESNTSESKENPIINENKHDIVTDNKVLNKLPVEAKSNSDINVKFVDTNRAATNPITDIFNESEDDDDLFQVKPKIAPPKSNNIDSKSEDKKLLQSSMIINKFTYLAAGSENKLKDSQAQSKTRIPNTTDVEQESIKAPPTSEAISKSPKLFEESTSDLSDDDDLFKIGSTKTVISKSSNDNVKNTLSSNASHQKTDLFAEPENLLHQNNKLVDHVKTNASSNRTPNIKTKIVGIFEDPIYRDSKTINNSEINVEVPKTSATTSIVESSTKAIKEKQELGNSNINDELVKEQREKSLYEQAASNIALFGDEPPIDIFEDLTNSKKSDNNKRITLFDDDEDEPDFFQDLSKTVNNIGTKEPFGIGLFDNEPPDDIDFKTKIKKSYVNTNKNDDKLFASVSNVANKFDQKLIDKNDDSNQVKEVKNENANDIKITSLLPKTNEPKKLSNLSNFNINVSALLPGARPPSLSKKHGIPDTDQSDSKSVTPIPEHDVNLSKKIAVDSRGDGLIHNYKEISNRKIDSDQKERNGDFISQTETLQNSAVKERVRIPQKRRPPSRRARQEAARKSLVLENSDSEIESVSTEQNIPSDFAKSMDENEKSLISKNSHIKSANKLTNELSSVINSSSGQPRINDNSSKSSFKEDLTDHSKSENSNSLSKSKSQAISSDHSESGSNIKDGTDILSPSTEEDDIFKIDKIADDDTLKVDEYNSIFNDSDDDVDDLTHDSENKAEVSKTDDIKRQKEFNLLEALTRNTESKPNMDAIDENILKTDSLFIPVDLDINSGVGLKPVPENTNIAGSISQKHSETNITDLKNNSSLSAQESIENDLFGAAASSNNDLEDKLSTLAIDGSAEVLHAAQVGKTSKDILFDSDLEEDLFTAKPMFISKNAQNVSQRGDVKPRSPLLNSVGADDLFAGLPRSNIILRKNRKTDNLFSDTEDDEDLFKVKTIKVSKSSTDKVLSNSKKSSVPKSASLFGDSDDDDDLFKVSTGKYS